MILLEKENWEHKNKGSNAQFYRYLFIDEFLQEFMYHTIVVDWITGIFAVLKSVLQRVLVANTLHSMCLMVKLMNLKIVFDTTIRKTST